MVRLLVLILNVAFAALQTGAVCAFPAERGDACDEPCDAENDDCDEEAEDCGDEHDACDEQHDGPCAPTCTDCPGCAGPSSALLPAVDGTPRPRSGTLALASSIATQPLEPTADRIDRPPRG